MRRLALTLIASCGVSLLSACGYGFTGSNNNATGGIDQVIFTNGSAQTNQFYVSPSGNAPIQINAQGQRGSGSTAVVVPDATFTWGGSYAPAGTTYSKGPQAAPGTCPAPPATQPAVPIYQQSPGATGAYPGFSPMASGQTAQQVYVGAVPGVPAPYCLIINATHAAPDHVVGGVVLVVSDSP